MVRKVKLLQSLLPFLAKITSLGAAAKLSALSRLKRVTFRLRDPSKGNLGLADSTMEGKMIETHFVD